MKVTPSALMDEDPHMLTTLASVIEWSDAEQARLAKEANRRR